jgi:succinate dehydrogenase / fumarate reductase flavoprotein subunit
VSEAITRSALERRESRGGHFRQDYPGKDQAFANFNVVVRQGPDGAMQVAHVPLPRMPAELQQIVQENA